MVGHEWFYWILSLFSPSQWVELNSTHWRSEFFAREERIQWNYSSATIRISHKFFAKYLAVVESGLFKVQRKPICAEINVTSALISKIIRSDKKQYSVTFYRFLPGNIQCILCNIFFIPGYYAEQCVNTMLNVWWGRSCTHIYFLCSCLPMYCMLTTEKLRLSTVNSGKNYQTSELFINLLHA